MISSYEELYQWKLANPDVVDLRWIVYMYRRDFRAMHPFPPRDDFVDWLLNNKHWISNELSDIYVHIYSAGIEVKAMLCGLSFGLLLHHSSPDMPGIEELLSSCTVTYIQGPS